MVMVVSETASLAADVLRFPGQLKPQHLDAARRPVYLEISETAIREVRDCRAYVDELIRAGTDVYGQRRATGRWSALPPGQT